MTAYGYIRKSRVHDEQRTISLDTQREAIMALAKAHGDDLTTERIFEDIDVSGRKDRSHRPGWNQLLTAVESGEASGVYGYSLSRFARSVPQVLDFFKLCKDQRVPVRMVRDSIDTSSATGRMTLTILAAVAEMEADVASERVKDAFQRKSEDDPTWKGPGNVPYGSMPGEDANTVLAAFEEARSFDGAARLLNEFGVPARAADSVWHGATVKGIVRRADPDRFAARKVGQGVRAGAGSFRLSRLLVCGQCQTVMTPSVDSRTGEVRYYCRRARVTPHGRGWVSEKVIIGAVAAEAEKARLLIRRRFIGTAHDEEKARRLEAKRARILDMAVDGMIDKADAQRRLAEVAEAERGLTTRRLVRRITRPMVIVDAVDDDGQVVAADSPRQVNDYLRRLLDRVVVESMRDPARRGPSKEPVRLTFHWLDPVLRSGAA